MTEGHTATPFPSEASVCNKALRYLGAAEILSLDQGSREADLCAQNYYEVRNELLCVHRWSFASRVVRLAALTPEAAEDCGVKSIGRSFLFRPPSDVLCVQRLTSGGNFSLLEGGLLAADENPVHAVVTAVVEDPSRFSPLFSDALARRLAAVMAVALVNNARLEQVLTERAHAALDAAILADAVACGGIEGETGDPWLKAR